MDNEVKTENPIVIKAIAVLMLFGSLFMVGAANLSEIFSLMQEIIDNTDVIVGMVIMGVTISIAVYIGVWIKKMLSSTISSK